MVKVCTNVEYIYAPISQFAHTDLKRMLISARFGAFAAGFGNSYLIQSNLIHLLMNRFLFLVFLFVVRVPLASVWIWREPK